jgi:hypothetical protein
MSGLQTFAKFVNGGMEQWCRLQHGLLPLGLKKAMYKNVLKLYKTQVLLH